MEIVLNWLSEGTNYTRWRGDLEAGKTKKSLCSEVLQIMIENGITHRDVKGKFLQPIHSSPQDDLIGGINLTGITQKNSDLQSS